MKKKVMAIGKTEKAARGSREHKRKVYLLQFVNLSLRESSV